MNYEEKVIDHIIAYSTITQADRVVAEILDAEVLTTSVMATNLPKVAPFIAKGLRARLEAGRSEKIVVMACENAIMGTDILKKAMEETGILTTDEMDRVAAFPNTAVDRLVFDGHHNGKDGIEIGDAFELAIERGKLPDPSLEPIKGAEYVEDLAMYLQRKIYMVNCAHAVTSYMGFVKGYETVQEGLADPEILEDVKRAIMESAAALEKTYGFAHEKLVEYMNTMIIGRFTKPGMSDPISRVAREPIRKISANDRIMGPAIRC